MEKFEFVVSKILLEEFYEDFIPIFLANYSDKNRKLFFESRSVLEFMLKLNLDQPVVEKEFYIIGTQLREKNISTLFNHYKEFIDILVNNELTLELIDSLKINSLIKCLLKACYDFNEIDSLIYGEKATIEDYEEAKRWLENNNSLFDYHLIFYEYHNNKEKTHNNQEYNIFGLMEEYLNENMNCFMKKNIEIQIDYFNEKVQNLENKVYHLEKIIEKKKNKNKKIREEVKLLKESAKIKINQNNEKSLKKIKKLKSEMNIQKNKFDELKSETISKKEYLKKRQEALSYLEELKSTKYELNKLKDKKDAFEVNLQTVEKYLLENGITKGFKHLVSLYDDSVITGKVSYNLILSHLYEIVYVEIEKDNYYFINSNYEKKELINLPESIYLQNYQMIAVSQNDIFINKFDYIFHNDHSSNYLLRQIISKKPYKIYDTNHKIIDLKKVSDFHKKDEIVKVNKNMEIIGDSFKPTNKTLHSIYDVIKIKNHKLIYLIEALDNGYIGYDFINKSKIVISNKFSVVLPAIVTLKDGELIKILDMDYYYNDSKFFESLEVAYILKDNDKTYIEFTNGKRINSNDFNNYKSIDFKNGDVIGIDIFNNIIKKYNSNTYVEATDEKKKLNYNQDKPINIRTKKCEIIYNKSFLIIGNESLSSRYIKTFKENGIGAQFVSGHESYNKIESKAYDSDLILFITEAASHQNFYKLRDNFSNKIEYINFQGANRLLNYVIDELI